MAEGFAAGLAGGLAQGAQLADAQAARQLAAERAQAQEQNYQSLAQSRIDAENRQAAADARAAQNAKFNNLQKYRTDLLSRASAATDPATQAQYAAQIGQVDSQLHDMFAGSPHVANAQASRSNARANATALANGQKTFADLPPNDVYEMMSHAVGVPADQVLRGPNGEPSAYEQALQDFHAGVSNSHLDNGAQALSGMNGAYGHVLHGYLGTMLPDGTVVDNAKFASPAAMPNGQIVPRVALSGTTADGRTATAIHPMFAAGATPANGMPVHTTTIPQVLANSNAKQGLIAAANHPDVAAQIKAATSGPQVAQHLDALHVAGAHPTYANPAAALAQQEAQAQAQVDYLNNVVGKPSRVQTIRNQLGDPIGYAAVGVDKPAVSVAAFNPDQKALDRSLIHQRDLEAAGKNQATGLGTNLDPAALAGFKNAFLANGITALSRLPAAERNQIIGGVEQDFRAQNLTEPQITRIFSNIGPRNKEQTALLTGRDGVQMQAINTIIPHIDTLAQLVQARQNNASPQVIRGLEQEFQQQFGQTSPVNVQQMGEFLRGEMGKYLNVATKGERERLGASLDRSLSNGQILSAIGTIKDAMFNRLDAIKQTSDAAGNLNPFVDTYLAPIVKQQYKKYMETSSPNTKHKEKTAAPEAPPSWVASQLKTGEAPMHRRVNGKDEWGIKHADGTITLVSQ